MRDLAEASQPRMLQPFRVAQPGVDEKTISAPSRKARGTTTTTPVIREQETRLSKTPTKAFFSDCGESFKRLTLSLSYLKQMADQFTQPYTQNGGAYMFA